MNVQHDLDTHIFTKSESTPKNIIMIVADGMGPAYTTAYRYYAD
ncbi:MAG TPA: alkaline phosphatase, partial [Glaciecola sp.]|nr:alkaline phosphatase [Glaciecola sp.]